MDFQDKVNHRLGLLVDEIAEMPDEETQEIAWGLVTAVLSYALGAIKTRSPDVIAMAAQLMVEASRVAIDTIRAMKELFENKNNNETEDIEND